MTQIPDLAELREVAEAATPGPWESRQSDDMPGKYVVGPRYKFGNVSKGPMTLMQPIFWDQGSADNAEHIATFDPPTVLALITRLEQAEQAVARVRESHTKYVISEWDLDTNSFKLDANGHTVPMASLCLECSGDEPIADAEDGNWTEDGAHSVYYPCPTIRALDGEQE